MNDWVGPRGVIETRRAEVLDAELDRICAITWCLSHD